MLNHFHIQNYGSQLDYGSAEIDYGTPEGGEVGEGVGVEGGPGPEPGTGGGGFGRGYYNTPGPAGPPGPPGYPGPKGLGVSMDCLEVFLTSFVKLFSNFPIES